MAGRAVARRHPDVAFRPASASSVSSVTTAVPCRGAVCCESRTAHEVRRSNTISPTRSGVLLVGRVAARVVELVEDVGVDPARTPLAVPRFLAAGRLDGQVVRVDLGRDAVEEHPTLAANGGRARSPGNQHLRERLDERPPELAAHLLTALRRPRGWRPGAPRPARDRVLPAPSTVGKMRRQVSGSVDSPFMTARAISRCPYVASAARTARRATSGSAWIPA